jgi:hypothetical protein
MKKIFAIALVALSTSLSAFAQDATVLFTTFSGALNAPIFELDGTTPLGLNYTIGLFAGDSEGNLSLVASTTAISGYAFNGSTTVTGLTPGANAILQVKAWQGGHYDYETATVRGESSIFAVTTSGNPLDTPPAWTAGNDPVYSTGFQSFSVMNAVPEPSTVALGVIGGLGMLLRRRKN